MLKQSLPKNWVLEKLTKKVWFQEGPGIRTHQYAEDGIRLLNIKNIRDGYLDLKDTKFLDKKEVQNKYKHFLINEGDILVSSSGTIGKVALAKKEDLPLLLNTSTIRFRSKNLNIIDERFLILFLKSKYFLKQANRLKTGSSQYNFGPYHLKQMDIFYPKLLAEQQKIASILETCESAIQKRKEANRLTDELLKSTFLEMFGDPLKNDKNYSLQKINDLLEEPLKAGIAGKPVAKKQGVFVIRPYNITNDGNLLLEDRKYISLTDNTKENYKLIYDDVVFNNTNSPPLVGKTAVFRSKEECVFSNHMTRVRLNKKECLPDYFVYTMMMLWRHKFFEIRCSQWVNQAAYNCKQFGFLEIPCPPIEKQQKFANLVQKVEKLKQKQSESEKELKNLFNSLMQKAFRGEL